ncbi:hypothetical protein GCM10011609_34620 [Lentzea pudingi]|uniref:Uncharacterized protein n=1 Tax=Lentzea pudingi TaxID=1789439 RepID=A0ABQ2HZZ7_9PSEU|nr:hypothetical protein [Lentzea pudingi]GGM94221.1 hypothetical protein GCM10011609_34620 [Lentzea pudingi]
MPGGRRPFVRDNDMAVLTAHVLDQPDPLPDHVLAALRQVVLKGLEKDRERRYQSAGELGAAARAAIDTIIMPAVRTSPPPARRTPRGLVWGAVAALAGAGAGLVLVLNGLVDRMWRPVTPLALAVAGTLIAFGVLGGSSSAEPTKDLNQRP